MTAPGYIFLLLLPALFYGCSTGNEIPQEHAPPKALPPNANILETDYLEATPGYTGSILNAEVIGTEIRGESRVIEINVPIDPDLADQVRVISPSGQRLQQDIEAEVTRDYENNNVGIKIFIPKKNKVNFKIRLLDYPDGD